jgi:hypothetical protein
MRKDDVGVLVHDVKYIEINMVIVYYEIYNNFFEKMYIKRRTKTGW